MTRGGVGGGDDGSVGDVIAAESQSPRVFKNSRHKRTELSTVS